MTINFFYKIIQFLSKSTSVQPSDLSTSQLCLVPIALFYNCVWEPSELSKENTAYFLSPWSNHVKKKQRIIP